MKTLPSIILAGFMVALFTAPSVQAQAFIDHWVGTIDGGWATNDGANWSDNYPPGVGNTVSFDSAGNGNTTIDLGSGISVGYIGFDTASAAAYTIGSGGAGSQTLTLDPSGTADPVSTVTMSSTVTQNQLVNANLVLKSVTVNDLPTNSFVFTNNSTGKTLTFAGGITSGGNPIPIALTVSGAGATVFGGILSDGAGPITLTKTGAGTLTLGAANTYTGTTTVTTGTLQVNGSLLAASQVNVAAAGTLAGTGTINGNVTLTGNGIIQLTGGTLGGTLAITTGRWNGSGSVAGLVTSSSGTLTIGSGANLTASAGLNVTGGALASGSATSTLTGSLNYTSSSSSTFAGIIAGPGKTLTLTNAAATLTLGGANTYTGATTINAGTLIVTGNLNNTTVTPLTFNGTGTFNYNKSSGAAQGMGLLTQTVGEATLQSTYGSGTASLTFSDVTSRTPGTAMNFVLSGGSNPSTNKIMLTNFGGVTTPTAALLDRGVFFGGSSYAAYNAGTNYLRGFTTGDTAYLAAPAGATMGASTAASNVDLTTGNITAQTAVSANTVNMRANSITMSASALLSANGLLSSGSTATTLGSTGGILQPTTAGGELVVRVNGSSDKLTIKSVIQNNTTASPLTKSGAGTLILTGTSTYTGVTTVLAGTLQLGSGSSGQDGSIANSSNIVNNTAVVYNLFGPSTYSGVISGIGSLTKQGAGTATLGGGITNAYTGPTAINAGKLQVAVNNALPTATSVTLANVSGAVLDLNGKAQTIAALSGGGTTGGNVTLGANGVLTVGDSTSTTFSGTITGSGTSGLTKQGSGILTVAGTMSYTGPTLITGGTLRLQGITGTESVFTNIPEAGGYKLVYALNIPSGSNFSSSVPYAVNNTGTIATGSFSRVGYYLELQTGSNPLQFVYASFDAAPFNTNASMLGVPNVASGIYYRKGLGTGIGEVVNMNVVSNVAGIVTGTGITTGNVEFWPSNYGGGNDYGVPNANAGTFDFGDGGSNGGNGYGSMQIHNHGASQTLFAFNSWNGGGGELGIGNNPSGNPDWTFTNNAGSYTVKNLYIVVGDAGSAGGSGLLPGTTALTVAAGATFDLKGSSQQLGSLSGGGSVTLGGGLLTVGDATSTTFSGTISGASGLTKLGAGTQTLTGALTYTGATTLTAGTLQVNGSLVGGPLVTVPASATLGVGTGGSVARSVTVTGGTVNLAGTLPTGTTLTLTTGTVNSTGTGGTAATVTLPVQGATPVLSAPANQELTVTKKLSQNNGGTIVTAGVTPFKVGGSNVVNNIGNLILQGGTTTIDKIVSSIGAGLEVRGWQGTNGNVDGATFNFPGSPTHSTTGGTIGYATGAIHYDNNGLYFSTNSSGVESGSRPDGYDHQYTVEYRGKLFIQNTGNYRFSTTSDDGSALWINPSGTNPGYATATVQNGGDHGSRRVDSNTVNLTGGTYADIIVRFYENGGGRNLFVQWDPTGGTSMADIPGSLYFNGSSAAAAISLPTTNLTVTADSTLKANHAATATLGDVTLTAGVLSFETATAMSFNKISATGDSGIAAGVPVTVRSGTVDVASGKTLTMSANMTGTVTVTKTGGGTLLVDGTKTYTAATTIADGTLSVSNIVVSGGASDLGNATSAVVLGDTTRKGTLSYTGNSANYTRGLTVQAGGGQIDNTSTGQTLVIQKIGATGTITGTNAGLTIGGNGDTTIITDVGLGAISGSLTKTGAGILNIFSGVQTYKTLTTVSDAGPTYVNTALGTGMTNVVANANLTFGTVSQKLSALTIGAGVTVTFTSGLATALPPLTTGYYLGTFSGNLGVWSASNGAASNWAADAAGTVTPLPPTAATDVIFSASGASNQGAMTMARDMAINSMTVTGEETNNLSLAATGGYSLTIGSTTNPGIRIEAGSGSVTLNPKIKLGLDQSWTNNSGNPLAVGGAVDNRGFLLTVAGSGTTNITGIISGSGGLAKPNAGALTLAGANTYTGPTTINAGAITTGVNSTSISGPLGFNSAVTMANAFGAALNIVNNVSIGSLTGGGGAGGSVVITAAKILTVGGDNTSPAAYAGVISQTGAAGALTKVGNGTLTLGGVNTYTGVTTVTGGTLQVSGSLHASSQVNVTAAGTLAGSGTINGNVTLTGNGIIGLTGGTIAGTLAITAGQWNGSGSVTGPVTSSSGTLSIGSGANLTANGDLNLTGGSLTGTGTLSGNFTYTSSASSTFAGIIAGSGKTVTFTSPAAALTLTGASTYTGQTKIVSGTLSATSIVVSGGSSSLGNAATAVVLGDATRKGTLSYTGNTATYTRGFSVLAGGGEIDSTASGQTLTLSTGEISGTNVGLTIGGNGHTTITTAVGLGAAGGALTKTGAGLLNINSGTQTYKTLTTLAGAGTTNVNVALNATGNAAVTANANIKFGSVSQKLASLTIGAGATVTFTSGTATGSFSGGGLDGKAAGSAVVPEPGTFGLLLAGSLGLLARRQRPARE